MKIKYLIIAILLSLIVGCGTFSKKSEPTISTVKQVQLDPKVLEPCQPLQTLAASAPQFSDVLDNVATNSKIYADCKGKQDTSIELLKKFANIK
ncbi:hypothetical protein UFOVP273_9 [uncultured Caudovirales phage]|uniref:Uncharacterized protein n=1 Tax=uncultured Caudovirales phage TaxID=2100421 RepID=A0A6J5LL15_9CAUD|nr:hypothetical protein UFOVP273_9 [uncultured Caudovirales phage]